MDLRQAASCLDGGSAAIFSEKDFLSRARNNFDGGVNNVVYGVTDWEAVQRKIVDVFGDAETERQDDLVVVRPGDLFYKTRYTFCDLVEIIYRLRDPDGCPWDRAQTNESIRQNIVEEAYELVEAIDLGDVEKMREESGDVLLQGLFTAIIADSDGKFSVGDVVTELCKKLVGRHTHIFGPDKATDAESALYFWEKAKAKEKHQSSVKDIIESVPTTFGALMRANKVAKIIKKTGFDFPTMEEAVEKLYEEVEEFVQADEVHKESEAGDILFSAVNVLRMAKIDPEIALNGTTNRFIRRFYHVIERAKESGRAVEDLTLEEMEAFYQEAKQFEKK
ncbi:MAG: nucleoside triphosphate pyrophosphohydrolase [Clostridia bacterium]|nr:nucleoside triphosphate pyrophosphohydrolase [Clostridia bacterium]